MNSTQTSDTHGGMVHTLLMAPQDSSRVWAIVLAVFVCLTYTLIQKILSKTKVPLLYSDAIWSSRGRAAKYSTAGRQVLLDGARKFPDRVWTYSTNDGVKYVIPNHMLNELRSHPALSFKKSIDNDMLVEYTSFGGPHDQFLKAVTAGINPTLGLYTPILHQKLRSSFLESLGTCADWTPVAVFSQLLPAVSSASARVFHSDDASKSSEWLEISLAYLGAVHESIKALKQWQPWLRPIVHRFMPQRAIIKEVFEKATVIVRKSLDKRKAEGGNLEDPPTMLDHLCATMKPQLADDVAEHTLNQMLLVAVGTMTTVSGAVQALYDLATFPEYIQPLREELLAAPRDKNGNFTKATLNGLVKMDSFMKESMRLNGLQMTTFQRATTEPVKLSDGTVIPKGVKLEAATCYIDTDPSNYPEPDKFDGMRFYRARQAEGQGLKHQFTSVTSISLGFGLGRHACPGRFLSELTIKIVLAEIVLNYDIKLPAGKSRPDNHEYECFCDPDPEAEVLLRRVV